jgi:hypothetical protein
MQRGRSPTYDTQNFLYLLFLLVAWWWFISGAKTSHQDNVYKTACGVCDWQLNRHTFESIMLVMYQ